MTWILVLAGALGVVGLALVWSEVIDFLLDKVDVLSGRGWMSK